MTEEPNASHQRKRLRLEGFDYATPGAYYFTIVTVDRLDLFGHVVNETMTLNTAGSAVEQAWQDLPSRFRGVENDEFVVMPNHVHGITWLTCGTPAATLPAVLRAFKSLSAREVNRILERTGAVWQRSYHERVIRNEQELHRFRKYISENPARWEQDKDNDSPW